VLVIAGPGSGKTQLLALRVANILEKTDALPNQILCLTFTESAASNMRERLTEFLKRDAYKVSIHTFHSFGTEIISQNSSHFFQAADFKPADDLTSLQILDDIFNTLPAKNPFRSQHQDVFVYIDDVLKAIDALKKGGVTPEEFFEIITLNKDFLDSVALDIEEIFADRISGKTVENLWKLYQKIEVLSNEKTSFELNNQSEEDLISWRSVYPNLIDIVLVQLQQTLSNVQALEQTGARSTTPVTEWKNKFTTKDKENKTVAKDLFKHENFLTLAHIYKEYQNKLNEQGYFDFSDMLLEVVKALKDPESSDLKYNLQEKYQFILVDEFQDTNGVQMKLLHELLDSPVNDGSPNILAVGDDDQAVYKFQGANLDNILKFKEKYPSTKVVTLNKNYRSKQEILDLAMQISAQAVEKLELDGVSKVLVSQVK
jgi:DNA helicase-2/ATP-dependent DNA helicase PcrA